MDYRVKPPMDDNEMEDEAEDYPALPEPRSSTVIARGITLSGALRGEGVIQVEGDLEGEIDVQGSLIVAVTGQIRGPVTADVIRVAGCIEGNVIARDHLRLEKTGMVEGDVTSASLVVEDGGRLNGRSTMVKAPEKPHAHVEERPMSDLQFGSNYKAEDESE